MDIYNEQFLISVMLRDRDQRAYILSVLENDDFGDPECINIFEAIQKLSDDHKTVDCISVSDLLNKDGIIVLRTSIVDLYECAYTTDHESVKYMISKVIDNSKNNKLTSLFRSRDQLTPDEYSEKHKKIMNKGLIDTIARVDERAIELVDRMYESNEKIGVGFKELDKILGGIYPSNLIVISANPKVGKTSFSLNVAKNISKTKKVLYYSFEMSEEEISQKMVAMCSKRPIKDKTSFIENYKHLTAEKLSLYVVEGSGKTVEQMRIDIARINPDVIFIDQLDCLPMKAKLDRHDLRIGDNVVKIKQLAMDTRKIIFLIHQLNRDAAKLGGEPELYHLKDSSIVEQKANIVLMLRKNEDMNVVDCYVKANRMGGLTGKTPVSFIFRPEINTFMERGGNYVA